MVSEEIIISQPQGTINCQGSPWPGFFLPKPHTYVLEMSSTSAGGENLPLSDVMRSEELLFRVSAMMELSKSSSIQWGRREEGCQQNMLLLGQDQL